MNMGSKQGYGKKKGACTKILHRNMSGEIKRERTRIEHKPWNNDVKEVVKESKIRVGEDFGMKLSKTLGKIRTCSRKGLTVRDEPGKGNSLKFCWKSGSETGICNVTMVV